MPCSQPGPARTVTVPSYQPPAPNPPGMPDVQVPTPTNPSSVTATVSWNPVSGATYYVVFVNGQQVWQGSSTTCQVNLVPGQTYQIAVAACN
jgi:hypothetical protein